jgi:hypothetical protein
MKKVITGLLLVLGFVMTMTAMADIIIGNPADTGTGNCFPWGCAYNAEYQQVYASSDFSGPIIITDLEFYNTRYNSGATQLPNGTWTISLSTTSATPSTITGDFTSNLGADNAQVFSGNINQAWTFGDTLQILLSTPFTYDPAHGNLLMDVVGSGVSLAGGTTYFDVNSTGNYFTRVICSGGNACSQGSTTADYGLVTGFSTGNNAVPEPGTLLLLGTGLLGFACTQRRRLL